MGDDALQVLVTGASGFVGGHCVRELVVHGHQVRGTVRDRSDRTKVGFLSDLGDVVLFDADLTHDAGWAEAMEGCDAVLHTASPLLITDDVSEVVEPAVQGTLRVLKAALAAGVKRVVMTSSTAAIVNTEAEVYTEAQWSEEARCSPYPLSKTQAERAAWAFAGDHPALELVSCNPCLVLGPLLGDRPSLSLSMVERLLARRMPAVPHLGSSIVDVRDVAAAHRLAMTSPTAPGNRYLLMSEHLWMRDVSLILAEAFGSQGYRPPTRHLPYPLLWLAGRFDPVIRSILADIGEHKILDSTKARQELGWAPRPARVAIVSTGQSLIERGIV